MIFAPPYVAPVRHRRAVTVRLRDDVTARRIKLALLTGPLALKGQRCKAIHLVARCEDIPGANVNAVGGVLELLMKQRLITRAGEKFWRVA